MIQDIVNGTTLTLLISGSTASGHQQLDCRSGTSDYLTSDDEQRGFVESIRSECGPDVRGIRARMRGEGVVRGVCRRLEKRSSADNKESVVRSYN
jgi:hypothetical protein